MNKNTPKYFPYWSVFDTHLSRDALSLTRTVIPIQQFQVVATETLNPAALESDVHCAAATEKIDGTCCYVTTYRGIQFMTSKEAFSTPGVVHFYSNKNLMFILRRGTVSLGALGSEAHQASRQEI